jgi:hypothetical protein
MKRRDFLKHSSQLAALGALSSWIPSTSWAKALRTDQYFMMIQMDGGWDISLSVDPWTRGARPAQEDYFIEYTDDQVFKVGDVLYGPAIADIKSVLADFSVIRGIFLSDADNGHPAAESFMRSGDGAGKYPAINAELVSLWNLNDLGVISSLPLYTADRNVAMYSIYDLQSLSSSNSSSNNGTQFPGGAMTAGQGSIHNMAEQIKKFVSIKTDLMKNQDPSMDEFAGIAAAMAAGLSRSIFLETEVGGLDTHSDHPVTHMRVQKEAWGKIANAIKFLKATPMPDGQSLFDKTTIVITSEFSRTPALDASKGKNHNPMLNAALVSGPGFKKSVAVGGSRLIERKNSKIGSSYNIALPMDLDTGRETTHRGDLSTGAGVIVTPQVLMATIADSMQISRDIFGCADDTTPSIKAILKT